MNCVLTECPICFRNYSEVDPTTLPCGHTCCLDEGRLLLKCYLCSARVCQPESLVLNVLIKQKTLLIRTTNMTDVSAECPICFKSYSEVDPTTLPCGHSCCLNDGRLLTKCHVCGKQVSNASDLVVNYTIRDIVASFPRIQCTDSTDNCLLAEVADEDEEECGKKKKSRKGKNDKQKRKREEAIIMNFCKAEFVDYGALYQLRTLGLQGNQLSMGFYLLFVDAERYFKENYLSQVQATYYWALERAQRANCKYCYFLLSRLSRVLSRQSLCSNDLDREDENLKRSADLGFGIAQFHYGLVFASSNHTSSDCDISWHLKAANANYHEAIYTLGCMYVDGKGVIPDVKKGIEYFHRGADLGCSKCNHWLGIEYCRGEYGETDMYKGKFHLEEAIKTGNWEAIMTLASLYKFGHQIGDLYFPRSDERAFRWLKLAVDKYNLGDGQVLDCRLIGVDIDKEDYDDLAEATMEVSERYRTGLGVKADKEEAKKYKALSALYSEYGSKGKDYDTSFHAQVWGKRPVV